MRSFATLTDDPTSSLAHITSVFGLGPHPFACQSIIFVSWWVCARNFAGPNADRTRFCRKYSTSRFGCRPITYIKIHRSILLATFTRLNFKHTSVSRVLSALGKVTLSHPFRRQCLVGVTIKIVSYFSRVHGFAAWHAFTVSISCKRTPTDKNTH